MALDPAYPAHESRKYKVREHTVGAVADVMCRLAAPSNFWMSGVPPGVDTALGIFVGYVMLDAWIANQDRHHENWGALQDDQLRLAPTFDHGASLARNLSDLPDWLRRPPVVGPAGWQELTGTRYGKS
jgi:hypothetical protein